ncbi:MAG: MMPL family transporter, partial [Planctomycetales bacterium]|nr:MMPL family transporter [Planctomycetales bacterium]
SRFRGFMADKLPARTATQHTVGRVGETITASAGTVIVGMLAMSLAEFKLYANLGPSLAIGVVVGLLAGLTLTPALLALLGRWAFWPRRPRRVRKGGFWGRVSDWVTARPGWQLTLSLVILLPLAVYGLGVDRTVDLLGDLPDDVESKAGFEIIADKFGTGMVAPLNIIMTDIPDTRSPEGIAYVDALTDELLEVEGVGNVSSLALPLGRHDPNAASMLRVKDQLNLIAGQMEGLRALVSD